MNLKTDQSMNQPASQKHADKSILARGCDPYLSQRASEFMPPLLGNPEYVPTTDDASFVEQLKSRKWSVVYFAPGACRYSAAKRAIPGGNQATRGWTLEDYRKLVHSHQDEDVQIVESIDEQESIGLLRDALDKVNANSTI